MTFSKPYEDGYTLPPYASSKNGTRHEAVPSGTARALPCLGCVL